MHARHVAMLLSIIQCFNTNVLSFLRICGWQRCAQVVANTGGVLGLGMTPHEIIPRPGRSIVDVDGVPFKGPKTKQAKWHKVCWEIRLQVLMLCVCCCC
jgi:hypothetical protein